jgi:aryl-alcohol dehydrogenase-like predicted oxidoreductase
MTYGSVPGIDPPISRLIMGTMVCSPSNMPYVHELLDHFVSVGGNCLDTARVYGTEGAIGQWFSDRGRRDDIVLIAKGVHHDANGPRVHPQGIAEDLAASLDLLQTDFIDLYLLHRDDPQYPVGPIVEALNEHRQAGRIRAFGGSNWTHSRLQEANDYAKSHGLTPFVASSPNFSLAVQNEPTWANCISASTLPGEREWYAQNNFPLMSWSSQAQGFFTGRYAKDAPTDGEMVRVWYNDANFERLDRANQMASEKGVTPIQIALAYVLSQPFPTWALIGPRTPAETESTMEGLVLTLTPDEMAWLNLERDSLG